MFCLFAGYNYYPEGGCHDLRLVSNNPKEIIDHIKTSQYDWWHIATTRGMMWNLRIVADQNGWNGTIEDFLTLNS